MNAHVRNASELVVELAQEMRSGGETSRSDLIRDQLDDSWRLLAPDEKIMLEHLSEDLYIIDKSRLVEDAHGTPVANLKEQLAAAFRRGDFVETLAIARRIPDDAEGTSPDWLAYIFGRCWERLGFVRAAAEFYDFAHTLSGRETYTLLALEALGQASPVEALRRVERIESDADAPASSVMKAASVLFQQTRGLEPLPVERLHQRVVKLVDRAGDDATVPGSIRAASFVAAGFASMDLGAEDRALTYFDNAVDSYSSDAALVARGLALDRAGRHDEAARDFDAAVKSGTQIVWPFLFLALQALRERRWLVAERLAQAGGAHAPSGPLRAQLFEWEAIAAASLQRDSRLVRMLFERAAAENPFELRIRRNQQLFEEHVGASWDFSGGVTSDDALKQLHDEQRGVGAEREDSKVGLAA